MRHHGNPIDQRLQLLVADRDATLRFVTRPQETALMESSRAQPDADPVVHQHLDTVTAPVGEEVGMMRARFAEHAHYARQRRIGAGSHVDRFDREPHRIDADHRRSSRSQTAQSAAAASGQATLTTVAPRRSSIVMSCACMTAGLSTCSGRNDAVSPSEDAGGALTASNRLDPAGSAVTTHRRNRFAFRPLAKATAAIDTPGWRHAATAFALNSALCVRRRRRPSIVFTCPPKS